MNFILGSGLIGCISKKILGSEWSWIPFKKSRYYSHEFALADDFIVCNSNVDSFMELFTKIRIVYKRPFSYKGVLSNNATWMDQASSEYKSKVYNDNVSQDFKSTFMTYDISCRALNNQLQTQLENDINSSINKFGKDIQIDVKNHTIKTPTGSFEYDKIINTLPLDALLQRCSMTINGLESFNTCIYRIFSGRVDIEDANQALVSDRDIDFYKVTKLSQNEYLFFTNKALPNPYQYFGAYLGYDFEIIDVFRINQAVPISPPPDLKILEDNGIYSVGSNAQWDDLMDVSSCINRILKLSGR